MSLWDRFLGRLTASPWQGPRIPAPAAAAPREPSARRAAVMAAQVMGRVYAHAQHSATSAGFGGGTTSADAELRVSLPMLASTSPPRWITSTDTLWCLRMSSSPSVFPTQEVGAARSAMV